MRYLWACARLDKTSSGYYVRLISSGECAARWRLVKTGKKNNSPISHLEASFWKPHHLMNPRGGCDSGTRLCLAVTHRRCRSTFPPLGEGSWWRRAAPGWRTPFVCRQLAASAEVQRATGPQCGSVCVRPPWQQYCQAAPSRTHMSALVSLPPGSHEQGPARPASAPQPVTLTCRVASSHVAARSSSRPAWTSCWPVAGGNLGGGGLQDITARTVRISTEISKYVSKKNESDV